MKILIVGLLIVLFWISMFLISIQYPTTDIRVVKNVSKAECFEMGCSYQPKSDGHDMCVCLVK
jgi:hypothetical protein